MSQKRSSGKYRDGCLLSSKRPYTVYQQSPEGLLFDNAYGTKGSHFRFLTDSFNEKGGANSKQKRTTEDAISKK
ncbi:hypothetical protein [Absicoccus intestinalis]|uniref:Uncharacterized protein n=1 Tax=Absicoccus intestinalis TaxID=2926319 RepID=A0ABU4WJL8_9FIRM|nr:hypothetical protein [Absicoccus sp. CLA-KB-P134]MDX8416439.1 hypothetical protein [Absicoccus sp. CLA-KB-P134]